MKVTHPSPDMQKQWHSMDQRVTSLIGLAAHGNDDELNRELKAVQPEMLKSMATYINKDGNTLLNVTSVKERMESLMVLVKASVDINSKNGSGHSALFNCINHNSLNSARLLLQAGADVNEIVCRQTSESLLHRAVKSNRLKALELLLDMAADTDVRTRDGETPLHFATRYNRLATAQILIQAGADVNATNKDVENPLHVAIATKSFELAKLLIHQKKSNMTLKDRRGMTPLHAAVVGGCIDLVKIMLSSNSAAINSKESLLGRTPLLLACSSGTQKMTSLLLSHGADANLTTNYRKSVLHVAASNGNVGALGAVIKFASNPNALSINNMTPLHYAVQGGYFEIVKILLKSGVNVNLKDIEGHNSLHMASSAGDNETLTSLLEHKVQVNATNMKQQTPLHLALINGHRDTGSILIAYGTDPTLLDVYDKTGMDYWEEYKTRANCHCKASHQYETDNFLFPSIAEEETPTLELGAEDVIIRLNEDQDDYENNQNEYNHTHRVNMNHEDVSEDDVQKRIIHSTHEAELNTHTSDYSLANGDISPTCSSDKNYPDDNELLTEDGNMGLLINEIEDVNINENQHVYEGSEFQTEPKHKKYHSNHRRVHKISTSKSKKLSTATKASKSKTHSNRPSNKEVTWVSDHTDCQRKRKVGTINMK